MFYLKQYVLCWPYVKISCCDSYKEQSSYI